MLIGIVERNQNIRHLLQIVCEYECHHVEFLEHHSQRRTHDVVLIDPGTPQDGFPLLRELAGTASIILTTYEEYFWACHQHHLPLLLKPFHLKELVDLVYQVGAKSVDGL